MGALAHLQSKSTIRVFFKPGIAVKHIIGQKVIVSLLTTNQTSETVVYRNTCSGVVVVVGVCISVHRLLPLCVLLVSVFYRNV